MAQVTGKNLSLGYEGRVVAENVSFSLEMGEYMCVVGPNGSGKTTFVNTLVGIQKPISGKIEMQDELRREGIGYLPQRFLVQKDFPASVREVVMSGFIGKSRGHFLYSNKQRALAEKCMHKMNIEDLGKKCFRELSGGQQQRVLLARTLCSPKKLLVLDEPVSGLDPVAADGMYKLIEELNKEEHISIIMVSHDVNAAMKYAEKILHIGGNNFFGTREEYLNTDNGRYFALCQTDHGGEND